MPRIMSKLYLRMRIIRLLRDRLSSPRLKRLRQNDIICELHAISRARAAKQSLIIKIKGRTEKLVYK